MSKRKKKSPKDKPLSVKVSKGVLTIEIGVDALAFASLRSNYAWQLTDPKRTGKERDPREVFTVTSAGGFAVEVKSALLEEAEDGSSLLTDVLDKACENAIEQGSQYWMGKDEEP